MKRFFDSIEIMEPIDPRGAFFGGCMNAVKLHHKIKRDTEGNPLERIDYTDICSLYPWVCKYGKFPVNHPKIMTENFQAISKGQQPYFGLIKCKVVPPKNLLHPVLPDRCNGKLMFPLCKICAETMQKTPCNHTDIQ